MANKKTTEHTELASGDIDVTKDLFRVARASTTSNFKIKLETIKQWILDDVTPADAIEITWDQLNTDRGNGDLEPMRWYHANDEVDDSDYIGEGWFYAFTNDLLWNKGIGVLNTFNISDRPCMIDIDWYATGGGDGFYLTGYEDDHGHHISVNSTVVMDRFLNLMTANNRDWQINGGTVTTDDGFLGDGSRMEALSGLTMASGCQFIGHIEREGSALMIGNQVLNGCHIGISCDIDLSNVDSNYAKAGVWIRDGHSNIPFTPTDHAAVNPNGSNEIDMTQIKCGGILAPDDGTNDLGVITNFAADSLHDLIIMPSVALNVVAGLGLEMDAASYALDGTKGDYIKFTWNPIFNKYVQSEVFINASP